MGPLKNARHEKFSQGLFEGKAAYQAYMDAGYVCSPEAARALSCRLSAKDNILARVAEMAGKAEKKVTQKIALTKDWVVDEMIDAAQAAKSDKAHSPRIRALELLGRETGNFTEQKRVSIRSFTDMSAEEIEAFLAGSSTAPAAKKAGGRRTGGAGKA